MTTLSMDFDAPSKTYYPGQTISGYLQVKNRGTLSVREMSLCATGYCKVAWASETRETYTGNEEYYDLKKTLIVGKDLLLLPGKHGYAFNFVLPHNIPASIKEIYGKVVHKIRVGIDTSNYFNDKKSSFPYTVKAAPRDLNKDPNAKVPIRVHNEKYVCCLWCRSGPLSANIHVDHTGYVPGENIIIHLEGSNLTKRKVTATSKIIKVTSFHTNASNGGWPSIAVSQNVSKKVYHPEILSGDTDYWDTQALTVPDVEPSLAHCGIIYVRYYLEVTLETKGASNMFLNSEIIIGTKPLKASPNCYNSGSSAPSQFHHIRGLGYSQESVACTSWSTPASTVWSIPVSTPPPPYPSSPAMTYHSNTTTPRQVTVAETHYGIGAQHSNLSRFH